MKIVIRVPAALIAAALMCGCNTPYNGMNTGQRYIEFQRQCMAVGHTGEMVNYCATDMERQLTQQRNRQIAAGVALVALGGAAVAYCSKHYCGGGGGGGRSQPYPGNCEYDWQTDAAGNRCGDRSAWSKPGGY